MAQRSYTLLFWCLALCGLAADQTTKYMMFAPSHKPSYAYWIFGEGHALDEHKGFSLVAQFHDDENGNLIPYVNQGALFGLGGDYKKLANQIFAAISLGAACFILYWSRRKTTSHDRVLSGALGLILAGTLGNFYDRIVFQGVRDFMHWNYLFNWPVFNIADCCLVVGACLLLLQAYTAQVPVENQEKSHAALANNHEATCAGQKA